MRIGLLVFALALVAINVQGCCLLHGCCLAGAACLGAAAIGAGALGCAAACAKPAYAPASQPSKPAGGDCGWGGQCATSSCIGSGHGPVVIAGGSGRGHSGASFGGNSGGSCGGGRGGCGGGRGGCGGRGRR